MLQHMNHYAGRAMREATEMKEELLLAQGDICE